MANIFQHPALPSHPAGYRELAGAWLRVAAAQGKLEARMFLALLGHPPRRKEPRCTYAQRTEQYAGK